jgi:hypothetical protein
MGRLQPADLGDAGLRHEVNVFIYRYRSGGPEYLLLHPQPRHEALWRPVTGAVELDEDLRHAALRRTRVETGLAQPWDIVSPAAGLTQEVGDLRLVEWPFGCQARPGWDGPQPPTGRHASPIADWNWCNFRDALALLGHSLHRQNLLQLHLRLAA